MYEHVSACVGRDRLPCPRHLLRCLKDDARLPAAGNHGNGNHSKAAERELKAALEALREGHV